MLINVLDFRDDRNMRQFKKLLETFSVVYEERCEQACATGQVTGMWPDKPEGDAKGKLPTVADKLLFTLYYFKSYPTIDVLGTQFKMVRSKAHENLNKWSPVLYTTLVRLRRMSYREFKTPSEL